MAFTEDSNQQISRIDSALDRARVGNMEVDRFAGLTFREYRDAVEFSKLIAQAKNGIPAYLKGNPADCLIVTTQALRWRLEPVWVMQNSYVARADGIINYENFVFAAVVMASNLLKGRPRYIWDGQGDDRTCTVSGTFKGETMAVEYTTPPLKQCRPPRNQEGVIKGSPLWVKDPDQQLGYYAIRNWARRYVPELLGGVYGRDEFDDSTQNAIETASSPNLMDRLPGKMASTGFQADVVDEGLKVAAGAAHMRPHEGPSIGRTYTKVELEAEMQEALRTPPQARQEAVGEPEPPPPPPPPPEPERVPEPPQAPMEMASADDYAAYAEQWISRGHDPDDIEARWDGEIEHRRNFKVPVSMRKRLQNMVADRCAELRKEARKRK